MSSQCELENNCNPFLLIHCLQTALVCIWKSCHMYPTTTLRSSGSDKPTGCVMVLLIDSVSCWSSELCINFTELPVCCLSASLSPSLPCLLSLSFLQVLHKLLLTLPLSLSVLFHSCLYNSLLPVHWEILERLM